MSLGTRHEIVADLLRVVRWIAGNEEEDQRPAQGSGAMSRRLERSTRWRNRGSTRGGRRGQGVYRGSARGFGGHSVRGRGGAHYRGRVGEVTTDRGEEHMSDAHGPVHRRTDERREHADQAAAGTSSQGQRDEFPPLVREAGGKGHPMYKAYQIIGDSQMLRFCNKFATEFKFDKQKRGDGLVLSGQSTTHLAEALLRGDVEVGQKIIMMIGSNDLRKGTAVEDFKKALGDAIGRLKSKGVLLLTLPPVPLVAAENPESFWPLYDGYNTAIREMETTDGNVRIVEFAKEMEGPVVRTWKNECFQVYYRNSNKVDMVHLNALGVDAMRRLIDETLERMAEECGRDQHS